MHRINARVALLGGLLTLLAAAAVLLTSLGASPGAQAAGSTPTNTPGPAPTPKPTDQTGELNGVYDLIVDGGVPTTDVYHCLAFLAHDGVTDDIKIAAQCYDNTGAANDPNAEPLNDATGEGSSADSFAAGPPPPPPYNANAPFKGTGNYTPDTLTMNACIPETGGIQAPNSFAVFTVANATADLLAGGKMTASVLIYGNQTDANCDAGTPAGTAPAPILATLYPAFDDARCSGSNCVQSSWRASPLPGGDATDWDGDGCTDANELWQNKLGTTTGTSTGFGTGNPATLTDSSQTWVTDQWVGSTVTLGGKTFVVASNTATTLTGTGPWSGGNPAGNGTYTVGPPSKCGDDPFNPNDTSLTDTDVAGDYSLLATVADEDCNPALTGSPTVCEMPGDRVPGLYYTCIANIAQSGKTLTAGLSCYIDSPAFVVNPQTVPAPNANATTCGPAPAGYCGDGSPGSAPPGITVTGGTVRNFGDVDTAIPVFTGESDNTKDAIVIRGCFADLDGFSGLGHVYATATADRHTGHGWILLHQGITSMADCNDGPPFADGSEGYVPLDLVRQTKDAVKRDSDKDGCADRKELTNTANAGGLRDPSNHYDYFDPTQNGQVRVNDILAVVAQYSIDDPPGSPDMKSLTDRTAVTGGNPWNLGPPNGQQRVDDILAVVKQYSHDCNLT